MMWRELGIGGSGFVGGCNQFLVREIGWLDLVVKNRGCCVQGVLCFIWQFYFRKIFSYWCESGVGVQEISEVWEFWLEMRSEVLGVDGFYRKGIYIEFVGYVFQGYCQFM